jgi:hypothetical protein
MSKARDWAVVLRLLQCKGTIYLYPFLFVVGGPDVQCVCTVMYSTIYALHQQPCTWGIGRVSSTLPCAAHMYVVQLLDAWDNACT